MNFAQIVPHLSQHGFCTRASWNGHLVIAYGMDNVMHQYHSDGRKSHFMPALACMLADDWLTLPFFWDGSSYDFIAYSGTEDSRAWRRLLGVAECDMPYPKQEKP